MMPCWKRPCVRSGNASVSQSPEPVRSREVRQPALREKSVWFAFAGANPDETEWNRGMNASVAIIAMEAFFMSA